MFFRWRPEPELMLVVFSDLDKAFKNLTVKFSLASRAIDDVVYSIQFSSATGSIWRNHSPWGDFPLRVEDSKCIDTAGISREAS